MVAYVLLVAVISILFGVLVIALPGFLRFLIGGYFILVGIMGLLSYFGV